MVGLQRRHARLRALNRQWVDEGLDRRLPWAQNPGALLFDSPYLPMDAAAASQWRPYKIHTKPTLKCTMLKLSAFLTDE